MTSINAIRFNRYQGAMVADETISAGGGLTYHTSDKVQSCIPTVVRDAYGIVGGMGTTGSCSVGESLKQGLHDWVLSAYRTEVEKAGQRPARFMDLDQIAAGLFDLIVRQKHQWISEHLRAEFGFDVAEFVAGSYERNGRKEEIKDRDVIRRITDWMSWKNMEPEVEGIFLNAALFAGYDDACGFQIYHLDLRDGYWHRVQNCYFAEGSGRQSVDPSMYNFVERLRIDERRGDIEPVEGLVAMLAALNSASEHEVGVGGYPTVMLFDGREPIARRQREIMDNRSWLATRVVKAFTTGYLERVPAFDLLEGLFYRDEDFETAYGRFWAAARQPELLGRLLRGYKVPPMPELRP
ncbi:MAG: hypothetical protein HY814_11870 [Candidatus Riflebacteria bacterium]|nr:hypothetical protein [Candidatus Riflebacteria bacterium]